jgi:hypothetical protein
MGFGRYRIGVAGLLLLGTGTYADNNSSSLFPQQWGGDTEFPTSIPPYPVRKDSVGVEVTRGRIRTKLKDFVDEDVEEGVHTEDKKRLPRRVPYDAFRKALQCASSEPDLDYTNGVVSLMKLTPPTKATLHYACAYAETRCVRQDCQNQAEQFLKGNYKPQFGGYAFSGFEQALLYRVTNNTLYMDWPWGRHRINNFHPPNSADRPLQVSREAEPNLLLVLNVLRLVQMNDSAFFIGSEQSMLPWPLAFPAFSYGTHYTHSEMPLPWPEMYTSELAAYHKAATAPATAAATPSTVPQTADYSDQFFEKSSNQLSWELRIPKAAFYASFNIQRRLVWDQAVRRPDLIEAPLHLNLEGWRAIQPWHVSSHEPGATRSSEIYQLAANYTRPANHSHTANQTHPDPHPERDPEPGYLAYLANTTIKDGPKSYTPGRYKYILVMGIDNAPSGRISHLLTHSGAVILLHRSAWTYVLTTLTPLSHYPRSPQPLPSLP